MFTGLMRDHRFSMSFDADGEIFSERYSDMALRQGRERLVIQYFLRHHKVLAAFACGGRARMKRQHQWAPAKNHISARDQLLAPKPPHPAASLCCCCLSSVILVP